MKITKTQLKQIIKEELSVLELSDSKHDNEVSEVGMSINQLQAISVISTELSDAIREMDYVPEWADGKISVALDTLNNIRSYMVGKKIGQED